ncbi:MAG TPA: hypothetical protein VGN78_17285 [Solirubrobacteraceae bacterium]|nr:hypothetical protein [Solirubrobacteraceae bacterium]
MKKPTLKFITMLAALTALALGGAGLAPASGQTTKAKAGKSKTHHRAKARTHRAKSKAKTVRRAAVTGDTTAEPNGTAGPNGAAEPNGTEQESASDGPGGHEDNPNDPNADHQFNGQE